MQKPQLMQTQLQGWIDLVYSEDEQGWYGQRHIDDKTTDLYPSIKALKKAIIEDKAKFDN